MKCKRIVISIFIYLSTAAWAGTQPAAKLIAPNVSPESKALLQFIYSLSGKYTLTGQHNFPNIKDRNTRLAAEYIGETPAVKKKGDSIESPFLFTYLTSRSNGDHNLAPAVANAADFCD